MAFYGLNLGTRIRGSAHTLAALLLVQRDIGLPMFERVKRFLHPTYRQPVRVQTRQAGGPVETDRDNFQGLTELMRTTGYRRRWQPLVTRTRA
jgi:hypothetical protein